LTLPVSLAIYPPNRSELAKQGLLAGGGVRNGTVLNRHRVEAAIHDQLIAGDETAPSQTASVFAKATTRQVRLRQGFGATASVRHYPYFWSDEWRVKSDERMTGGV